MIKKRIIVTGSNLQALASACLFAKAGHDVTLLGSDEDSAERFSKNYVTKNKSGAWTESSRGNQVKEPKNAFTFESVPFWHFLPEVTKHFFELTGKDCDKTLHIETPIPAYQVIFKDTFLGSTRLRGDKSSDSLTFDAFEPHAASKLSDYIEKVEDIKVKVSSKYLYNSQPLGKSSAVKNIELYLKLNLLSNFDKFISGYFESNEIKKILSYPFVFLRSSPKKSSKIYSIYGVSDFTGGVKRPAGGLPAVYESMTKLAEELGATIKLDQKIEKVSIKNDRIEHITTDTSNLSADIIINCQGAQLESLFDHKINKPGKKYKSKPEPSALIIHLGVKARYEFLDTHNFILPKDIDKHLYGGLSKSRKLPADPVIYLFNSNKSNSTLAPANHENLMIYLPISPKAKMTPELVENYTEKILESVEQALHLENLRQNIVYKKANVIPGFESNGHAMKQLLRPNPQKHPSIDNLFTADYSPLSALELPVALINAERLYKAVTTNPTPAPS